MLALLLVACGRQALPTPTSAPSPAPTLTQAPTPTPRPILPTATEPPLPTPSPTVASLFAPVSDSDWQVGPKDARVTIVEYSDFQ